MADAINSMLNDAKKNMVGLCFYILLGLSFLLRILNIFDPDYNFISDESVLVVLGYTF